MNMNTETIQARIDALTKESAELKLRHDAKLKEFQQIQGEYQVLFTENHQRFQQMNGAIAELKQLLNGEKQP